MKKIQLAKITFMVAIVALLQAMPCYASNPSELTGLWFNVEAAVLSAGFANMELELFKDGTGVFGGKRLNWKVENKRFAFIYPSRMEVYDYKISNGKLTLTDGTGTTVSFLRKDEYQKYKKSLLERLEKEGEELRKKRELEEAEDKKKYEEEAKKIEEKKRIEAEEKKKRELEETKKAEEAAKKAEEKKRAEEEERRRTEEEEKRRIEKISSYFTDSRDGKKYRTVKIGTQTWMAQNLDYAGKNDDVGECYNKNPENCKKYGTLYDVDEAEKVCPSGWHLPNNNEWETLINFAGGDKIAGKKLKAKMGWAEHKCKYTTEEKTGRGNVIVTEHDECATDEFGFSALPGGSGSSSGGFYYFGSAGEWWISREEECWSMSHYTSEVDRQHSGRNCSVRCLKN